jgi:hypothetical protein
MNCSPWSRKARGRLAILILAAACGGPGADAGVEGRSTAARAADSPVATPRVAALPPRDSVSAHAPTWDLDLAVGALRSAGLDPVVRGPVREPFLGVAGTLVEVTRAELELFVYGDAVAAGRELDGLDTLAVSRRGRRIVWRRPPALVTSNNLVTIVLTADSDVRERVRRVLGTIRTGEQVPHAP